MPNPNVVVWRGEAGRLELAILCELYLRRLPRAYDALVMHNDD